MFEPKDAITEMVEALWRICGGLNPGDYLTRDQVATVTGAEPHVSPWPQVMKRLRRRILEERGITIWPENGVGYRFLTPAETLEVVPLKRLYRAKRQIARAQRSVDALPAAKLTLHQKRMRAVLLGGLVKAKRDVGAEARREAVLFRKTETLPRAR